MADINIEGLDKVEVFKALYEASAPIGMGMMQFVPGSLTPEDEERVRGIFDGTVENLSDIGYKVSDRAYFDYFRGRVMKVDLSGDEFDPALYDRDNGDGHAAAVVADLRRVSVT